MAAIRTETHVTTPDLVSPTRPAVKHLNLPSSAQQVGWIRWGLTAAAVLLLIFSNIYWIAQLNDANEQIEQLQLVQREFIDLVGIGEPRIVNLMATAEDDESTLASVLWNPQTGRASLFTEQLPQLSTDRTYQLWLIGIEGAVSAGLFQTDSSGTGQLAFQSETSVAEFDAIGISVEPASGSDAPTTDPIAVGAINH